MTDALGKSQIFINGTEVKPAGDPRTRITSGFLNLVDTCYISRIPQELTDKDIPTYLQKGDLDDWMSAYKKAVLDYVQKEKSLGQNVLLPKLTDRFSKRPYGWTQVATACMVAALYAKGKIEMVDGSGQLTDKEVSEVLGKTKNQDKVQITVVADYSPTQIRNLKKFHEEYFGTPVKSTDAKGLAEETSQGFATLEQKVRHWQDTSLPFNDRIVALADQIGQCAKMDRDSIFTQLLDQHDAMLDTKEDVLDPIEKFLNGPQWKIYQDAKRLLNEQQANAPILGLHYTTLQSLVADPDCYTKMVDIKQETEELDLVVSATLRDKKTEAIKSIEAKKQEFLTGDLGKKLPVADRNDFLGQIEAEKAPFETMQQIWQIHNAMNQFTQTYADIIAKAGKLLNSLNDGNTPKKTKQTKQLKDIDLSQTNGKMLATPQDVEEYLASVRAALLKEIENGNNIYIN